MVVLGLILVLIAVVAGAVLVFANTDPVTIHAFGGEWSADAFWLAVLGAIVLLVAVLGIALVKSGTRRGIRAREQRKALERENAALVEQVAQTEHTGRPSTAYVHDLGGRTTVTGTRDIPPTVS